MEAPAHALVEVLDPDEPRDRDEALALINAAMQAGSLSMDAVFPLLIGPRASSRRLIVRDGGKVAAHAAARAVTVALRSKERVRLVNVGCVCTAERAQRRGFASLLVEALLASGAAEGADVAVLWSSRPRFYERLGFHEAGVETSFRVARSRLAGVEPPEIRAMRTGDVGAVLALRARDEAFVERTAADLRRLLAIPRSHAFVVLERGELVGYLVVGKGLDYPGMVAEWAMPPALLPGALRAVLEESGARETLVFGPPRGAWLEVMEGRGHARDDHALAMFALLDRARLCRRLGLTDDAALDDRAFLARLLGRPGAPEPLLPLYFWGLDSN